MSDAPRTNSPPEDLAPELNATLGGWNAAMGLRFVRATGDEVVVEWEVGPQHLQSYGIVHGGVHAGVIETIASVGAGIYSLAQGRAVVGLENHTSFLHAVREGRLRATARPLTRGRSTHVWEAVVTDAGGRLVATGRVRLFCLESGVPLAGQTVGSKLGVG
jgi:1,4-dihydroxy-2-naphthoyl-CoA hydrolase